MSNRNLLVWMLFASAAVAHAGSVSADQVFLDDVIINPNLCVGGDCASGETFGFATIRVKRNNTRIDFVDTSTGSFPTTDWRIEANSSASSGAEYFAVVDMGDSNTGGIDIDNPLFYLSAGAPANSIFVAGNGNVGLGSDMPERDLSLQSGDTPTIRLKQDDSTGKKVRSWDITSNQKAFVVKDASKNRKPFRIVAGSSTDTLVIAKSGKVGIGVEKPAAELHTVGNVRFEDLAGCGGGIMSDGDGTLGCIVSSRKFKIVTGDLTAKTAVANVMALRPRTGAYTSTPDQPEHWLIAEETAAVDPAFVSLRDDEPYTVKMQNVVADLIAVVQEQQRRIDALERQIVR